MSNPSAAHEIPLRQRGKTAVRASRQQQAANLLLLTPASALMAIAFLLPLAFVLKNSVLTRDGLSLFYLIKFLSDPFYLGVLWRTLRLGLIGTIATLIPGYVVAYNMVFHPSRRFRMLLVAVAMVPLVVNLVIRVYGWISILSPDGTIHEILGFVGFGDVRVRLLYTEQAIIIGFIHSHLTFVVLPVVAALSKIDPALLRAAENLGATSWRRFIHVILPLSLPGIIAGTLICFSLNISDFVVPALLGGESVRMMTYLIYEQELFLANDYFAATETVILMVVSSLAIFGGLRLAALYNRRFAT